MSFHARQLVTRPLRSVRDAGLNLVVGAGIIGAVLVLILVLTVVAAWIWGGVDHVINPPPKHSDPLTQEVCWVQNGVNGLERVRGPRSAEPADQRVIEVSCS